MAGLPIPEIYRRSSLLPPLHAPPCVFGVNVGHCLELKVTINWAIIEICDNSIDRLLF